MEHHETYWVEATQSFVCMTDDCEYELSFDENHQPIVDGRNPDVSHSGSSVNGISIKGIEI